MRVFERQVAVVTGASGGIGKAIALGLAAQGASLCLVGRDEESLQSVGGDARMAGAMVETYRVDLTQDDAVRMLAERLRQGAGRVDILVHSAGIITLGSIADAPVEELDLQYKINTRAPFLLTQVLLPMLKSCQGQIVFMNSSVGVRARANVGQYAATKHALRALADSLRDEVNADGLRVLSVFLGRTDTPMQAAIHKAENRAYSTERLMQPEDVGAAVISALSMPRSAEMTDITLRPLRKLSD